MPIWETLYRSELKKMVHTLDEIKYETRDQLHVKPDNFLNGHDVDCTEDKWTNVIVDPSEFIGKTKDEIYQNLNGSSSSGGSSYVSGYLTSSRWIRFNIEPYGTSSSSTIRETDACGRYQQVFIGDVKFEKIDTILKTGDLYICIYTNEEDINIWNIAHNVEYDWDVSSESQIRPDSIRTYFGYYFRNNYLYLYVSLGQYIGWVRLLITDFVEPENKENYITNEWCFSESGYAYRNVSVLPSETNADELFVCGNMVPYNETFQGIRQYYNKLVCSTHVEDDVEISIYEYQEDVSGDYIKISSVSDVGVPDSRKEHRFIPKTYEGMLPTRFSGVDTSEIDYYLLNQYLPLYLHEDNPTPQIIKLRWERSDSNYYTKTLVDPSNWYPS